MAEITVSREAVAVWMMTGVVRPSRRMASITPMPSRSGMTRSRIMAPILRSSRKIDSACSPPVAVSGLNPALLATSAVRRS
ncbi:hypothetical protein D9M68_882320 [compost metagenome]